MDVTSGQTNKYRVAYSRQRYLVENMFGWTKVWRRINIGAVVAWLGGTITGVLALAYSSPEVIAKFARFDLTESHTDHLLFHGPESR